jgi:putative membrane protein (TIGR04086 family)
MQVQSLEQKEKKTNSKKKKTKHRSFGWIFAGLLLLVLLTAAAFFLLWAWVSYHMRFSAEVIRAGLLSLYILPCLLGGKILTHTRCAKPLLWGAGLGIAFALLLSLGAAAFSYFMEGVLPEPDLTGAFPPLLCILSGVIGAIRRKKTA